MPALLFREETFKIVGAAMEVYNTLGPGFLEAVYEEALGIELTQRGIPFVAQQRLPVHYKSHMLQHYYVADMIAYTAIIIELKALERLTSREQAQLLNELKATGLTLGLLLNFGNASRFEWQRLAYTPRG